MHVRRERKIERVREREREREKESERDRVRDNINNLRFWHFLWCANPQIINVEVVKKKKKVREGGNR